MGPLHATVTARATAVMPKIARATAIARGGLGGIVNDVTGGVDQGVDGATSVAGDASGVVGDASQITAAAAQVQEAYQKWQYYYGLYEKYKFMIYVALIGIGVLLVMCCISCAVQWMQNCCFCIKCGIWCIEKEWICCGKMCLCTKHCVCGLEHAIENAHKRGKNYDGVDQTCCYRHLTGTGIPGNLKDSAHLKWYGDTRHWFGRNIARLWNGHHSRVVRTWTGKEVAQWQEKILYTAETAEHALEKEVRDAQAQRDADFVKRGFINPKKEHLNDLEREQRAVKELEDKEKAAEEKAALKKGDEDGPG